jgi:plasmid stabilization system protein ParE
MNSHRVIVLSRAARDVDSIVAWLTNRSPLGAQRWVAALDAAKIRIGEDPFAFPRIPEKIRTSFDARYILFKTPRGKKYRAIFTVIGDEVRILRIRRPAQRPVRGRDLPLP